MLSSKQKRDKWQEIKAGIRNLWRDISEEEIEAANGDFTEIASLIEDRYNESKEETREKFEKLMDSFDNDTDKNLSPDESSFERKPPTSNPNLDWNARH